MLSHMTMHNTSLWSRSSTVAIPCKVLQPAGKHAERKMHIDCLRGGQLTYGLLGGHRDNQRGDEVGHIVDAALAHSAEAQSPASHSVNECMKLSVLGEKRGIQLRGEDAFMPQKATGTTVLQGMHWRGSHAHSPTQRG